jgi:uncharacterized protein YndB with AHSA1/START domain
MADTTPITIEALIDAPIGTVWKCWNTPEDIMQWNAASDDWHTPSSTVDLREGGTFTSRMEAKDGSFGFDFGGTYTKVEDLRRIDYVMGDGRKVSTLFEDQDGKTKVTSTFDPESENPAEMQRQGWQSILNNFKKYAEGQKA